MLNRKKENRYNVLDKEEEEISFEAFTDDSWSSYDNWDDEMRTPLDAYYSIRDFDFENLDTSYSSDDGYEGNDEHFADIADGYITNINGFGSCKIECTGHGGGITVDTLENMRITGTIKVTTNLPEFEFKNVFFSEGSQLIIDGDVGTVTFTDCGFNPDFALDVYSGCNVETEGHCYFVDDGEIIESGDKETEEGSGWGMPIAALAIATLAGAFGRKKVQVVKEEAKEEVTKKEVRG